MSQANQKDPKLSKESKDQKPTKKKGKESKKHEKVAVKPVKKRPKLHLVEVPSDEIGRVDPHVENLACYHGFLGREETNIMLTDHGDFLVRQTEIRNRAHFVISIQWKDAIHHILVKRTKTKKLYWTSNLAFKSVCELVVFHKRNKIPIFDDILLICALAKHRWQVNHEQVTLSNKLGEGQFGEVFKGRLTMSLFRSRKTVAVKTLHENNLSANDKVKFLEEAMVMLTLQHPNVIRFYGVCTMKAPIMIVMEFCKGKSLEDSLTTAGITVTEDQKQIFLYHAICGIQYLHSKNIIHRDIAARNCLLSGDGVLKISDFGLSAKGVVIKERRFGKLPVKYMAPETLKKGIYSTSSDVYSYGALIYEVYHGGRYPFNDCGIGGNNLKKAIVAKTVILSLTEPTPEFIRQIFNKCRHYMSEDRCSTDEIIQIFLNEVPEAKKEAKFTTKLIRMCKEFFSDE